MRHVGVCEARYDLRMLRCVLVLFAGAAVGCAAPRRATTVGSQHAPYAGLPEYLGPASRQRHDDALKKAAANRRHGGTAPIHLSAAPSGDAPAEDPAASPAAELPAAADTQPGASAPTSDQPPPVDQPPATPGS